MDARKLTEFFKWCTIINVALFFVTVLMLMLAPDFVYRMQSFFLPIPREAFDLAMYSLVGIYKIIILVFSIVPYVALLIIRGSNG